MAKGPTIPKANREAIETAIRLASGHTLLQGLPGEVKIAPMEAFFTRDGYARIVVEQPRYSGWIRGTGNLVREPAFSIELNGFRRLDAEEWLNLIGQCKLHVALDHCSLPPSDEALRVACELEASELLRQLGVGRRSIELPWCDAPPLGRDLQGVARALRDVDAETFALYRGNGVAGVGQAAWSFADNVEPLSPQARKWLTECFAAALRRNIVEAVETAGAAARGPATAKSNPDSLAEQSRRWFVAEYPLLGALAAAFDIVEDEKLCDQLDISIAAVNAETRTILVNPRFPWRRETMDFVIAHELMHVGLRHDERRQGRDPVLWNVACDYVINGWLFEMGVGVNPVADILLDPELVFEKESAEAIYDRMTRDMRTMRRLGKLKTLRGQGLVDMISDRPARWWTGPGADLDAFYRRALAEGLDLHRQTVGRGLLPGGLVEEIRALQQPPIPWDVALGQWLDAYFPPLEARRSYRRASRRQSASPDIPRPVHVRPLDLMASRTFGVIVDTSGSMSARRIGQALGAIVSYALSREVPLVRVVQCDAGVHDMGYVEPEALAGRVEVRGRGGTVLMPAVRLLETSASFPRDAPILVITDGLCDTLTIRHDHAYLMPPAARLPFHTRAPVFWFEAGE